MFAASSRKSSSSTIVSANSSTSAGGLARAAIGIRPTRCGAIHDMTRRSLRTRDVTCGRWTLTTTCSPVRKPGGVDLGDRRGCQRRAVEPLERRADRPAELLLDHLLDHRPRLGLHLVAAELELVDELGGEETLTRGDDLPELDVRRSEPLGREAQALRDHRPAFLGRGEASHLLADQPRHHSPAEPPDDRADAQPWWQLGRPGQAPVARCGRPRGGRRPGAAR